MSHELKTPLTAIIGAAKTHHAARARTWIPTQQASFLEMIERQGNRLLRLVEDVLATAQIEAGRPMARVLIDLRAAAQEVITDLKRCSHRCGARHPAVLRTRTASDLGRPIAFQQVLTNLVENALKYSSPPGAVMVTVTETPDEGILEVADQGVGITEEKLQLIFDRFQQVDSSSTRKVGGFGLGLFIVKQTRRCSRRSHRRREHIRRGIHVPRASAETGIGPGPDELSGLILVGGCSTPR